MIFFLLGLNLNRQGNREKQSEFHIQHHSLAPVIIQEPIFLITIHENNKSPFC